MWRHAHLKQHLGSRDGYRTRQLGGSGLKSTTGGSRGAAHRHGSAQPERRETKCKKEGAKPPHGLCWANKLSHGLAHITCACARGAGDGSRRLSTRLVCCVARASIFLPSFVRVIGPKK